jgi:hypothetical protein
MTYHISKIDNKSDKSVAIANPRSGRDSRLTLPTTPYTPEHPIEVAKFTEGTLFYQSAAQGGWAMNIFTKRDNWFIWDNGKSQLWSVNEDDPAKNHELYKGSGGHLWLTVESNGSLVFAAAK